MIVPGSVNPLLLATGGYDVPYSLRFRAANSAYLSRTPASSSSQTTYTFSYWFKRGNLNAQQQHFAVGTNSQNYFVLGFGFISGNDQIDVVWAASNVVTARRQTNRVFRDPSAWYHVVVALDTGNATANSRVRVYVNGVEETSFANSVNPTQSSNQHGWNTNVANYIGAGLPTYGQYHDGYMAEVNFIDGQALTPSSFGQTDIATGVWVPKKYSGTYGTNGFYLKFADASAATAAAIGKDSSGNGNNWTPSGISVTSGTTFDQMLDTPTLNYCVLNPLSKSPSGGSLKNANMTWNSGGGGATFYLVQSTFVLSGKCYWECVVPATLTYHVPGIMRADQSPPSSGPSYAPGFSLGPTDAVGYRSLDGDVYLNSVAIVSGATPSAGDIIQFAFNAATGELWIGRNGTWLNSGDPAAGTGEVTTVSLSYSWVAVMCDATTQDNEVNFGQRAFSYTPPTGFKALNSANLPTPNIKKGGLYMDVKTWTATGTDPVVISGLGFSPDLVWAKARNDSYNNVLVDKIRGVNNVLSSNSTNAEATYTTVTQFNSDGFNAGGTANNNFSLNCTVTVARNYVAWTWKEGATPGFDIVAYTGTGSALNVSHALGAVPKFMVIKAKDNTVADNWGVYHGSLPNTQNLYLNLTNAAATASMWNSTTPTSSVFTVGANNDVNRSGRNYISYLWSEIEGFSKFGSYTGNGSTDGPFVWCGHRPRWLMIKDATTANLGWRIYDTVRETFNEMGGGLEASSAAAENYAMSVRAIDVLSNGFKIRVSASGMNGSGVVFVFAAFAENPFKYARAR